MENLKRLENNFIKTGVVNLSEFFKINRELLAAKVKFDMIPPSFNEWHEVEYSKEIKVFDEAWVNSVVK